MNAVNLLIVGAGGEFLARRWSVLEEPDLVVTVATTVSAALELCDKSPDRPRVVVGCDTPPNSLPAGWCGRIRALAAAPLLVIRLGLGWPPHAEDAAADEADFSLRGVAADETWLTAVDAVVRLAARNVADRRCVSARAGSDGPSGHDLERLRFERASLEAALEYSGAVLFCLDDELRLSYFAPGVTDLSGSGGGAALGLPVREIFPGNMGQDLEALIQQARESGRVCEAILRRSDDGAWQRFSVCPCDQGIAVHSVDVTPERRREAVARERQERLRSAVEAADMVTWWFDVDNACYIGDAALIRLLGPLPADSSTIDLGTYLDCVYPADRDMVERAWHGMLRECGTLDLEYRVLASDGGVRWVRDRGRLLTDITGRSSYAAGALLDITERQQMKQELKSKEERFQRIVMTANEGIWEVDAEFSTSFVNPRMAGMLGYAIEEMIGMPEVNLVFEEDLPDYLAQTEMRRRGIDSRYQRRLRRKDGTGCLTWVTTTALPDDTGRFVGSFGTFTDISELKRLEEALRCREREFANLVEHSPDLIFRLDRDGEPVYVNSSGALTGALADDAAPGDGVTKPGVVARLCELEAAAIRQVFDDAEEREIEVHLGRRCLRLRLVPERCKSGSVETVLGIAEDVTAQRAAEHALRRTEALLAAGMRIAGLGIAEWDIRQELFHISDEGRQMHGVVADRLTLAEIELLIHPDDLSSVREVVRSNADGSEANALEYRIVRPDDGTVRLIRVTGSLLKDEQGEPVRAYGIVMDVTEQRQREEDIRTQAYILDNIAQGVNYVDEAGLINYTNPAFDAMFGYQRGELIGRPAGALIDGIPGETQRGLDLVNDRLARQGGYIGEFRSRRKDGTLFPTQATITRLPIRGRMCTVSVLEDITVRTRALEALRESEQRLTTVLEKTDTGLWDFCPSSGQAYFSPIWYTMLGYAPDEFPAAFETWEALVHPDDLGPAREALLRAIESEESSRPYELRIRMLARQGGWRWIDTRGIAVSRGADGRALRMVGTHTDVTDRVEAEKALRDSEERYHSVLINLPGAVYRNEAVSPARALVVTAGVEAITGRPAEAFLGCDALLWRELIAVADRGEFDRGIAEALQRRMPYELEYRIYHADGSVRWVSDRGRVVCDESGRPAYFDGVVTDITARNLAEVERNRLAEFIEATSDVVAIADADSQRFIYMNRAGRELLGIGADERLDAMVISDFQSAAAYRQVNEVAIPTARSQGIWRGESVVRTPAGRDVPISAVVLARRSALDDAELLFTVVRDISDLKQAENALQAAHDQLKATLAAIPDPMFEVDSDGRFLGYHAPDDEVLCLSPDQFSGRTIHELMPPEVAEVTLRALDEAARTGCHRGATYRMDLPRGPRWFELSVARKSVSPGCKGRFLILSRDITYRHQAETALGESLERLRLALTAAQMDVFDFEPGADRVRRTVNRGSRRGLPSEGSGKAYLALVHPEDRKGFLAVLRALSPEQPSYNVEYRARDQEGIYRWIADWAEARFDDSGRLSRIVGVAADIDERKKTEIQLRELNERMALAVSISGLGFYQLDLRTGDVEANPEYLTQLGYRPGEIELTARLFESWLYPGEREMLRRLFERHIAGHTPYFEAEYRVQHKNGAWVWIVERSRVVGRDADGTPDRVVGVHLDITPRRRSEEVLREKDERFRLWSDATDSIFWVSGISGLSSARGGALQRTAGRAWGEHCDWPWIEIVHPEDRKELCQRWERARSTRGLFECESRIWHAPSREYRWYLDRGIPRNGGDGEVLEWVGMSVDIQRQKEAEAALQEADRCKDEFLAMLGHELRNPLASIRTAGELLGSLTPALPEVVARVQDVILRQSDHLVRLVDDLLDVARLLQGKIRLQREVVDIGCLMRQVADSIRPICNIRCQQLTVSAPERPCFVQGDPVRMTQIIENLLTNASKYTPDGGCIRLEAEAVGDDVELRVIDDGIGIRADLLSGVFSLFTQDERNLDRSPGGLGIGLTVVKQLVELHGGLISAHSAGDGKGSEFVVRLPLFRGEIPSLDDDRSGAADRTLPGSLRVMIVDDNRDALTTLASLLELHGHQVATAFDGQTALELAQRFRPEVVLLDIGLPGMDGYEVARRLRASEVTRTSQIIAVTGYGQQRYRQQAQQAGFDVFLAKPIRFEQILQAMATGSDET